ncbi:MAG TPA: hypothetical protein DCQ64_16250 [Candidatus Rokubacteria bacterium]|nr:hypothetical protein [Candidatus Rokubacteria bacterium]
MSKKRRDGGEEKDDAAARETADAQRMVLNISKVSGATVFGALLRSTLAMHEEPKRSADERQTLVLLHDLFGRAAKCCGVDWKPSDA